MQRSTQLRRWAVTTLLIVATGVLTLSSQPAMARYAAMVVDADTGRILHAVNGDTQLYPASLTKMMTLYMAFEALDRGHISLDTRIRMSPQAVAQPPSKLGLKVGASISVSNAIQALVTKSANDVSVALAEALGGTESRFAVMMTERARSLGMTRTTFRNASGLPNTGQLSTARDMATLALALLRHYPHHYRYFSTRNFTYGGHSYHNHNRLLGSYSGVDGIKTGYIRASGFNLVASAKRNGRRIVGVIYGGETSASRNQDMARLLDKGFREINTASLPGTPHDVVGAQLANRGAAHDTVGTQLASRSAVVASTPTWVVQVGAFRARDTATKTARDAARHVRSVMPGSEPQVHRSRSGNGTVFYLARVAAGNQRQAEEACRVLERRSFRCLTLHQANGAGVAAARVDAPRIAPPTAKPPTVLAATEPAFAEPEIVEASGSAPGGSWGVQVGAFPVREMAERTAAHALMTVPGPLGQGAPTIEPLTAGARTTLYRARVIGITRQQAEEACRRLEGHDFPCLVVRL